MNIFKQFYKSLYSPKDIATFRFQGIGKSILYVFMLALLSVIPTIFHVSTAITTGIELAKDTINEKFPEFSIENGVLTSNQTKPIIVDNNDFTIYFDSSGEINQVDLENEQNAIGILQNELVFVAGGTLDSVEYATLTDFSLAKEDLTSLLSTFDGILPILIPLLALTIFLFISATKFFAVTILALLGLLITSVAKRSLKYGQLWRISAYSVTLPTLFFTIMEAFQTNVPGAFLINWTVSLIMVYLTVREIPQRTTKL